MPRLTEVIEQVAASTVQPVRFELHWSDVPAIGKYVYDCPMKKEPFTKIYMSDLYNSGAVNIVGYQFLMKCANISVPHGVREYRKQIFEFLGREIFGTLAESSKKYDVLYKEFISIAGSPYNIVKPNLFNGLRPDALESIYYHFIRSEAAYLREAINV